MKKDELTSLWESLAESLITTICDDGPQWIKGWISTPVPRNAITGVPYQGRNSLLLTYVMNNMNTADPRFLTFATAAKNKHPVRRGEKSCASIERWGQIAKLVDDPTKRIPQPKTPEEWEKIAEDPRYYVIFAPTGRFNLFHASQCEGFEPFEDLTVFSKVQSDDIDTLNRLSPCKVNESPSDVAGYSPDLDAIYMPSRSQFSSFEAYALCLLHEQTHATGAKNRLNRPISTSFGTENYAREELVAELGALFAAQALQISYPSQTSSTNDISPTDIQNHRAYLKSWASSLEDPVTALKEAIPQAVKASQYVLRPYNDLDILESWRSVDMSEDTKAKLTTKLSVPASLNPQAVGTKSLKMAAKNCLQPAEHAKPQQKVRPKL